MAASAQKLKRQWHAGPGLPQSSNSLPSSGELKEKIEDREDESLPERNSKVSKVSPSLADGSTLSPRTQEDDAPPPYYEYHQMSRTDLCNLAKTLKIGVDLPVKGRFTAFFDRYGTIDMKYSYVREGRHIRAVLQVPMLERTFEGQWALAEIRAKQKVREVFILDKEVLEIAKLLPPTMPKIRAVVSKIPLQRDLKESGIKYATIVRELAHYVLLLFRDMGCRTAVWDGQSSNSLPSSGELNEKMEDCEDESLPQSSNSLPSSGELKEKIEDREDESLPERNSKVSKVSPSLADGSTLSPRTQEDDAPPPYYEYHQMSRTDLCNLAKTLKIGVDLPVKGRFTAFFDRYGTIDMKYSYVREGRHIRAVLQVPMLERTFEGQWALAEIRAKQKVREVFILDKEVLEIAKLLPPTMPKIRAVVSKIPLQRDLKESGIKYATFVRELAHYVLLLFRDMGCRTAAWDEEKTQVCWVHEFGKSRSRFKVEKSRL